MCEDEKQSAAAGIYGRAVEGRCRRVRQARQELSELRKESQALKRISHEFNELNGFIRSIRGSSSSSNELRNEVRRIKVFACRPLQHRVPVVKCPRFENLIDQILPHSRIPCIRIGLRNLAMDILQQLR